MHNKNQKLELTWIGKGDEPKLEPRILIEQPEYSYGDSNSGNILIHGDNLLALKALEQEYSGKIKCIYIDPPYNTGSAFEHYDDNLEHSIWLKLMYQRLKLLSKLISEDGFIFVNIDDNEHAYLGVILDEIFGRKNKFDKIAVKTSASQGGFGGVNPGLVSNTEYIYIYTKDKTKAFFNVDKLFVPKSYDANYTWFITNIDDPPEKWEYINLNDLVYESLSIPKPYSSQTWRLLENKFGSSWRSIRTERKAELACKYPKQVFRTFNPNKPADYLRKALENSKRCKNQVIIVRSPLGQDKYCLNGEVILFYDKMMRIIDNQLIPVQFLTTFWDDIPWEGISNEGNALLRNGKKPEKLIKRILEITTIEGDIVLDSFLGSGTTSAVAHKMGRKWIGIELGEHARTLCYPRLKGVIDGEQSGISKSVNWKGGGGFRFYTLAPSLLNKDRFGNWIISKEYNPDMLAAAMAKQEGFKYEPDEHIYWKQGKSSEKDFIFTTTRFITVEILDNIHDEMQAGESLLIACKAFQPECEFKFPSMITLKKIPQMLIGKCEFGKDDYSLNIINLPGEYEKATLDEPLLDEGYPEEKVNITNDFPTNLFDQ